MVNYALGIGNVGFTTDDLPEELPFNGEQTIAVRKFPGGRVHIQNFGAFENEITLKGDFMGGNAFQRAQDINKLRVQGNPVLLRFRNMARYVIISKYVMTYKNDSLVSYEITLQPSGTSLQSTSVGSPPVAPPSPPPSTHNAAPSSPPYQNPAHPPAPAPSPPKPPPRRTHVIRRGDTFWGLAVAYYGNGTQWHKIAAANPGMVPTRLRIGAVLVIPY